MTFEGFVVVMLIVILALLVLTINEVDNILREVRKNGLAEGNAPQGTREQGRVEASPQGSEADVSVREGHWHRGLRGSFPPYESQYCKWYSAGLGRCNFQWDGEGDGYTR